MARRTAKWRQRRRWRLRRCSAWTLGTNSAARTERLGQRSERRGAETEAQRSRSPPGAPVRRAPQGISCTAPGRSRRIAPASTRSRLLPHGATGICGHHECYRRPGSRHATPSPGLAPRCASTPGRGTAAPVSAPAGSAGKRRLDGSARTRCCARCRRTPRGHPPQRWSTVALIRRPCASRVPLRGRPTAEDEAAHAW
jgi:hypothetical protein